MTEQQHPARTHRASRPALYMGDDLGVGVATDASWTRYVTSTVNTGTDARLCQLLARVGETHGPKDALPFVTPIVGSGSSAGLSASQRSAARQLPGEVAKVLTSKNLPGGKRRGAVGEAFLASLLRQRVPEALDHPGDKDVDAPMAHPHLAEAAEALLAAALLHAGRLEIVATRGEHYRPEDPLPLADRGVDARIDEVLVSRCKPALDSLKAVNASAERAAEEYRRVSDEYARDRAHRTDGPHVPAPTRSFLAAAAPIIDHLAKRLDEALAPNKPGFLTGGDIDALVEVAWLLAISPLGIYPGWRDLFSIAALGAATVEEAAAGFVGMHDGHARPHLVDLNDAVKTLSNIASLAEATQASWASSDANQRNFYRAVAELLVAQSQLANDDQWPAVAFVTSFDVELEMALARAGKDFTVMAPYHFVYENPNRQPERAMLFWLATRVEARDVTKGDGFSLSDITPRWRLAPHAIDKATDPIIIVRLVGSPLMKTPEFTDTAFDPVSGEEVDDDRFKKGERLTLQMALVTAAGKLSGGRDGAFGAEHPPKAIIPAFVMDDNAGLNHILAAATGNFPQNLVSPSGRQLWRFWLAVGVPFDDSVVRLLVASYLDRGATAAANTYTNNPERPGEHGSQVGVMVNRRGGFGQADVLTWQGFSSVRSTYSGVTTDLVDYAHHLEGPGGNTAPWVAARTFEARSCGTERRHRGGVA